MMPHAVGDHGTRGSARWATRSLLDPGHPRALVARRPRRAVRVRRLWVSASGSWWPWRARSLRTITRSTGPCSRPASIGYLSFLFLAMLLDLVDPLGDVVTFDPPSVRRATSYGAATALVAAGGCEYFAADEEGLPYTTTRSGLRLRLGHPGPVREASPGSCRSSSCWCRRSWRSYTLFRFRDDGSARRSPSRSTATPAMEIGWTLAPIAHRARC